MRLEVEAGIRRRFCSHIEDCLICGLFYYVFKGCDLRLASVVFLYDGRLGLRVRPQNNMTVGGIQNVGRRWDYSHSSEHARVTRALRLQHGKFKNIYIILRINYYFDT